MPTIFDAAEREALSKRIGVAVLLALALPAPGRAQTHSAFPVDIVAGPAPQPVRAAGQTRLLYELHVTNLSASPIEILELAVLGDDADAPLASYRGEQMEKVLEPVGPTDTTSQARTIGGGRSVVIFLDLVLPDGTKPPAELRHRFALSIARKRDGSGGTIENTVHGPVLSVVREAPLVLPAPLRGSGWVALNSIGGPGHRRALNPVDGKVRIAQRYAIDWVSLGPDGRLFHGDPKSNTSFYDYGAEVLAVADGRISDLKDGLPENAGVNEASSWGSSATRATLMLPICTSS